MSSIVLGFPDMDGSKHLVVGGKGASLGMLARIEGIRIPDGFCITTEAFKGAVGELPALGGLLDRLSGLNVGDREAIAVLGRDIRRAVEGLAISEVLGDEIRRFLAMLGEGDAYAVRSSATAEDLPTASFAGQHDTYLNIVGEKAIFEHISKCWASLFSERAITYRIQNGIDHRHVQMAVIVQKMVFPQAAGILFTADPVTSSRKVSSIDASFGLGEALVTGRVNADVYKVRGGEIIERKVATKQLVMGARCGGGTSEQAVEAERQNLQTLTDEQILQLERIGRTIEGHLGRPQDIEWCLKDDAFYIVQSRPITTLFPIPAANDHENHVYVSVGHQQMMTDPMKPLGWSFFQLTAARPMYEAGGRLFVDVTPDLASPARRGILIDVLGKSDPLFRDAMTTLIERGDFIKPLSGDENQPAPGNNHKGVAPPDFQTLNDYDPSIVADLIQRNRTAVDVLQRDIQSKSGVALFDFIREDMQQFRQRMSDRQSFGVIMTAINASAWLNDNMLAWLGEKNVADVLTQSVPNNVTSEMGLALLDVADVIRPYPEVRAYLQQAKDDDFLQGLETLEGGQEALNAIRAYLDDYGMRCSGEIDITRTRWSEKPSTLVPVILGHIKSFAPGAGKRKFEQGQRQAWEKERELLDRLAALPDGEQKVEQTKRMIGLVRNLIGYREYPKYSIVRRYFAYRQALLKEAERLVQADIVRDREDIYYLTFEELREAVRTNSLDYQVISQRKADYALFEKLTPPRVITSDGEIMAGEYKRENLPAGALVGLPVSAGVAEGRARVILSIEDADLEDGDILVTTFTDPSWTPLFVAIRGLVTEVGGLMTHGAVIAREYGLPAVVGVRNATQLIRDGQRIRVHGTEGYVEIL